MWCCSTSESCNYHAYSSRVSEGTMDYFQNVVEYLADDEGQEDVRKHAPSVFAELADAARTVSVASTIGDRIWDARAEVAALDSVMLYEGKDCAARCYPGQSLGQSFLDANAEIVRQVEQDVNIRREKACEGARASVSGQISIYKEEVGTAKKRAEAAIERCEVGAATWNAIQAHDLTSNPVLKKHVAHVNSIVGREVASMKRELADAEARVLRRCDNHIKDFEKEIQARSDTLRRSARDHIKDVEKEIQARNHALRRSAELHKNVGLGCVEVQKMTRELQDDGSVRRSEGDKLTDAARQAIKNYRTIRLEEHKKELCRNLQAASDESIDNIAEASITDFVEDAADVLQRLEKAKAVLDDGQSVHLGRVSSCQQLLWTLDDRCRCDLFAGYEMWNRFKEWQRFIEWKSSNQSFFFDHGFSAKLEKEVDSVFVGYVKIARRALNDAGSKFRSAAKSELRLWEDSVTEYAEYVEGRKTELEALRAELHSAVESYEKIVSDNVRAVRTRRWEERQLAAEREFWDSGYNDDLFSGAAEAAADSSVFPSAGVGVVVAGPLLRTLTGDVSNSVARSAAAQSHAKVELGNVATNASNALSEAATTASSQISSAQSTAAQNRTSMHEFCDTQQSTIKDFASTKQNMGVKAGNVFEEVVKTDLAVQQIASGEGGSRPTSASRLEKNGVDIDTGHDKYQAKVTLQKNKNGTVKASAVKSMYKGKGYDDPENGSQKLLTTSDVAEKLQSDSTIGDKVTSTVTDGTHTTEAVSSADLKELVETAGGGGDATQKYREKGEKIISEKLSAETDAANEEMSKKSEEIEALKKEESDKIKDNEAMVSRTEKNGRHSMRLKGAATALVCAAVGVAVNRLITLLPKVRSKEISLRDAASQIVSGMGQAVVDTAKVGGVLAIVDCVIDELGSEMQVAGPLAQALGVVMALKQWKDTCRESDVALLSVAGAKILGKQLWNTGFDYVKALPGANLGMAFGGPLAPLVSCVGAVLSTFLLGEVCKGIADSWRRVSNWWCRSRPVEKAMRDIGICPESNPALFNKVSHCVYGKWMWQWFKSGFYKTDLTEEETKEVIADLKKHWKKAALKWHPDKNRGDVETMAAASVKFREAKAGQELLESTLNDRLREATGVPLMDSVDELLALPYGACCKKFRLREEYIPGAPLGIAGG